MLIHGLHGPIFGERNLLSLRDLTLQRKNSLLSYGHKILPRSCSIPTASYNSSVSQIKASDGSGDQRRRQRSPFILHESGQNSSGMAARAAAVEQLLRINEDGAYIGLVGGSAAATTRRKVNVSKSPSALSTRDARLVTEVVAGVTRWQRRLDFVLGALMSRTVGSVEPVLRQILRMGLYELVEMQLPTHAVNTHVELAKRMIRPEAGRLVNGVLRTAVRLMEDEGLPAPERPSQSMSLQEKADLCAIAMSHPTWLVERWLHRYGEEATVRLLQWNNARPHHSIRANTLQLESSAELAEQLAALGIDTTPSAFLPREFLRLQSGMQDLVAQGLLGRGICQVQDEAAGLVVALLDPQPGESILDACAAPGGKTLFAAARMKRQGRLVAMDISASRLKALTNTAQRQGLTSFLEVLPFDLRRLNSQSHLQSQLSQSDPFKVPGSSPSAIGYPSYDAQAESEDIFFRGVYGLPDAKVEAEEGALTAGGAEGHQEGLSASFDRVLVDAPCSGLGVLAKRADLRWRRREIDMAQLTRLQDELLDAAAIAVKLGGLLVYSTCSIEPEENGERVAAFLLRHPGFQVEQPPVGFPASVVTDEGFFATLPHVHNTDGAFGVRLRRLKI